MKKDEILKRQQELLNAAKAQNRDLSPEEKREWDNLQGQLEAMERQAPGGEKGQDPENGEGHNRSHEDPENGSGENEAQRALANERARCKAIRELCRSFNMDDDVDSYIDGGHTVEQVRSLVLEKLAKNTAPVGAKVTADEGDKFRAAAVDGFATRAGVAVDKPSDGYRDFQNMPLRNLAIECLSRDGQDARELLRMNPDNLYNELCRQYYNPTSAFPAIMDQTIKKSIVSIYNNVPTTFQLWTTKGQLPDFKESKDHEYVMGGLGDFEKIGQNGEIKADMPKTEMLPTRKLETYGKQFSMTRQAFVNDDISFMAKIPGLYAAKAKQTIDKQVYGLLYNNGKIFDGKNLFGADHKNVAATESKPTQVSMQEMILQMQQQTDQFGEAIYVNPKFLIVPVGYQFDIAVILHSTQVPGSANNDYNPMLNYPIQVVQSPVLNALAKGKAVPWFMVADPLSAKSIQIDYLNGQETPIVRRMEAPGTLAFVWDIYTDWGISVRDFRGISRNNGVAM